MADLVRFMLLGLGAGAIYGLLAQGIIIIYRTSRVLNLAQGAMAMVGAFTFFELRDRAGAPAAVAVLGATAICALLGAICYLVIMRPLQQRPPLAGLIATLGIMMVLQAIGTIRYGTSGRILSSMLPMRTIDLPGGAYIGLDRFIICTIGIVLTAILWVVYRFTSFGRVTAAISESDRAAAALGYSGSRIATANWMLGSGLGGFAGAVIAPISGLQVELLAQLVVPALAAALAAGFVSFPLSMLAGFGIGVGQAMTQRYVHTPGWGTAVPLLVVITVLMIRGRTLPNRSYLTERLPRAVPLTARRWPVVAIAGGAVALSIELPLSWVLPLTVTAILFIIGLSVVAITGLGGQLSLAAYAFAGVGALVAGRAAQDLQWPFLAALVAGMVVAGLLGLLFGLPALRTRGANLAVITLGLGAVMEAVVFKNPRLTGSMSGIHVGRAEIAGWEFGGADHIHRYAIVCITLGAIATLALKNLRRGVTGRRLLAVRASERAAASVGISILGPKLYAFCLSAVVAGVAGTLLAFRNESALFDGYGIFNSITITGLVVVGSVGFPSGALIAAVLSVGALLDRVLSQWFVIDRYIPLIGGIGLILTMVVQPDGVVADVVSKIPRRRRRTDEPLAERPVRDVGEPVKPAPKELQVDGLRVSYAMVQAVDGVSLRVSPGQVVGLIGPNGAGKTSIIDALTGYAKSSGGVLLDGDDISGLSASQRARQGLARTFQSLELFDDLTVFENLVAGERPPRLAAVRDLVRPRAAQLSGLAHRAVDEFALDPILERYPTDLSFGTRRLVGLARALSVSPSVLLLDEPAAGLDTAERAELARLIRQLATDWGMAVLVVEHDMAMVMSTCDHLIVLQAGRVLASGDPKVLARDPRVVAAYIGDRPTNVIASRAVLS